MAKFVSFAQANAVLKGIPREGEKAEDDGSIIRGGVSISPLPVWHKDEREFISCWQLTPKELDEVIATGKVWLCVLGALNPPSHPPVFVTGTHPAGEPYDQCLDVIEEEYPEEDDEPGYSALKRD